MTDPIFVKTGPYASYGDFYDLATLSGFETVGISGVDLHSKNTYIFATFDEAMMSCLEMLPTGKRTARAIFWYLERPDANLRPGMDLKETFNQAIDQILSFADEIWVSDRLVHSLDGRLKFAVFGGHEGLAQAAPREKLYGAVHFGHETPRRKKVLDELANQCALKRATWGSWRDADLASSRLLVIIDRVEGLHVSNSMRWVVAAAYRLPVIQERIRDPFPTRDLLIMVSYEDLAKEAVGALKSSHLEDLGEQLWDLYCREWTFRRGVEEALQ